jgi:hypothetical protein
MTFGFVDILTIFLVTVGPLKALIVFGALRDLGVIGAATAAAAH